MKRTILRYAALLSLLGMVPHRTLAVGERQAKAPTLREITTDTLQQLCGGRLPVYASGDGIWIEIPTCELRLTVQLDRGAGMRNRVLPNLPPFLLEADPATGMARVRIADTLRNRKFGTTPLPLARIAGSERLLVDIHECLYNSGPWYECSEGILRNQRYGHESLLGVEPTAGGTLMRIRVWYHVESPERSTEILMSSGALPLEISFYLTAGNTGEEIGSDRPKVGKESPIEVVVGSTLPEEYADVLQQAVAEYNRHHRRMPLQTVPGEEVIPLTTPYGISYDASADRLTVHTQRIPARNMPTFVRINLGAGSWEQEALRHSLRQSDSYRTLRQLLSDAQARRHNCLMDNIKETLEEAFGSAPKQFRPTPEPMTEKRLAREFRDLRKRMRMWNRFMSKEASHLTGSDTEIPAVALYEAMLAETQQLYAQMARQSRGMPLQNEILEWIIRGMITDAKGRFSIPLLRDNGLTASPSEMARRQSRIWKEVLAVTTPELLAGVPELFRQTLKEHGEEAFTMQDSFLVELERQVDTHPEFSATVEALERLYTQLSDGRGSATALFAELERLRLEKIRIEINNLKDKQNNHEKDSVHMRANSGRNPGHGPEHSGEPDIEAIGWYGGFDEGCAEGRRGDCFVLGHVVQAVPG